MSVRGKRMLVALATLAIAGLLGAPAAQAYTTGFEEVAAPSDPNRSGTGYGPGWVGLTFDTGGDPHGPIIGYLFHAGLAGEQGSDHMDVYHTIHKSAASVTTPFAEGYAYGHFTGCAWSYLDPDAANLIRVGDHHNPPCQTPASYQTKDIFCASGDPLCNDGHSTSEPEAGVWKKEYEHPATIKAGGCDAYGNVGADAIYHGGPVAWANPLGHVSSGTVHVRYVTHSRGAAMVLMDASSLPHHIRWAFVPRSCLT
ncbi:MAG TPA: hypothetical protein VFO16_09700 [Pseudonocardiaceae bacterium]|nr:hypothetical protein [Pseudonocardiaceae bacterium]